MKDTYDQRYLATLVKKKIPHRVFRFVNTLTGEVHQRIVEMTKNSIGLQQVAAMVRKTHGDGTPMFYTENKEQGVIDPASGFPVDIPFFGNLDKGAVEALRARFSQTVDDARDVATTRKTQIKETVEAKAAEAAVAEVATAGAEPARAAKDKGGKS